MCSGCLIGVVCWNLLPELCYKHFPSPSTPCACMQTPWIPSQMHAPLCVAGMTSKGDLKA